MYMLPKSRVVSSQQTFVGLKDVTGLQCSNFSSSKTSSRRLQEVLEEEKLLRRRRLEDMSWSQPKCLLGISVSNHGLLTNLSQYLTNLYLTNLYLTNLRRIQNALIRTQNFYIRFRWKLNQPN